MNVKGSACRKKGKKWGKTGILGAIVVFCVFGYFAEASRKNREYSWELPEKMHGAGEWLHCVFPD